jgi:hypothetical protein
VRKRAGLLWAGLLLICTGILLILLAWFGAVRSGNPTPEPIVPTRTPTRRIATLTPIAATIPTGPPDATRSLRLASYGLESALWLGRPRWGVGVPDGPISLYDIEPLRLGWYLDWWTWSAPTRPGGVEYVHVVKVVEGTLWPSAGVIAAIARANPGSLWLIGNEPDVKWQGNARPRTYARLYHEAHAAIKTADPTARIAIGGVSQPTPLRRQYLEAVLESYQRQFDVEMPIDVWNIHNFILREERGSWGVGIPPGMRGNHGVLYEIDDSGDLEIFQQQIVDFRQWMARHGYQDHPLIVSEYGILMPADYGFPPERVAAFLTGSFEFFLTAADPALGYPADDYRLVQMWCWYSLDAPADYYPTGNIYDPQTKQLTAVGNAWREFVTTRIAWP